VAILATRSTQCVSPLDGTLRVDLRSTKRAPARLSDISFVSAGKKRGFCQFESMRAVRINARASVRAAFRQCDALTIASMLPGAGRKYRQLHFASRCHMARFKWRYVTKRLNGPRFPPNAHRAAGGGSESPG
jgi:hypothetical protein